MGHHNELLPKGGKTFSNSVKKSRTRRKTYTKKLSKRNKKNKVKSCKMCLMAACSRRKRGKPSM